MVYRNTAAQYFYLILFLVFLPEILYSQQNEVSRYTFLFQGESLEEVLDITARASQSDLIYDPQMTNEVTIYKQIKNETFPDLLRQILKDVGLDYVILSTGTYVIIRRVEEEPLYGSYTGKVKDADTGEPLPGATVMLVDASGGTTTNRSGNFALPRLVNGPYQIVISYVGYKPVNQAINIEPGIHHREEIQLQPQPVDIAPVVVEAHQNRFQNRGAGRSNFDPESDFAVAGLPRDPIRALSLLPGIQYGLSMTGLNFQGGQPSEHRILLDGVPVYNPHNFGQLFSAFSPYAIGNIELHKAGFGVEEGSLISGALNMNHDITNSEETHGMIQADPLSINAKGDFYIPLKSSGINVMTALRTNFWDLFQEPNLKRTLKEWDRIDPLITNQMFDLNEDASVYNPFLQRSDIHFFDYHLASKYEISPFSSFSASFYLADNAVTTELLDRADPESEVPPFLYGRDSYLWNNIIGQLSWESFVTPRLDMSVQASINSSTFSHKYRVETSQQPLGSFIGVEQELINNLPGEILPIQIDGNRINHTTLRVDGSYSFTRRFKVDGGFQSEIVTTNVDINESFFLSAATRQHSRIFSSYLNIRHTPGNSWKITAGTRLTYLDDIKRLFGEPRASVQYDRPDSGIGYWSGKISGGVFRQFINQHDITNSGPTSIVPAFSIWSLAGSTDIPIAYHLAGSFLVELTPTMSIRMESFYKWQPKTTITSFSNLNSGELTARDEVSAFAEITSMQTFGTSLRINQSLFDKQIKLLAGYDYNYSRIDFTTQFGRKMPAPWNEPHRVQFRALWNISPSITLAGLWQGVWGRTWAFRQAYYDFLLFQDIDRFPFDNPASDKLKPFQQADLSIIYRPVIRGTDFEFRLQFINIFDRQNTIDRGVVLQQDGELGNQFDSRERTLTGFHISSSIKIQF